jgi:HlyD family secretion protein
MKRVVIPVVVIVALISTALVWKLRAQDEALSGPPSGSGVVEATEVDLSSRLAARIVSLAVRQGDTVSEGQLLMELDCAEPEAALAEAEARARAAQAQAEAASSQTSAAERNVDAARAASTSLEARIGALNTQRDAASRQASRVESLGEYATESRLDQVRSQAEGLSEEVEAVSSSQRASRHQTRAAAAQAEAAAAQAQAAARNADAVGTAVARARLLVAECRIVAPRAGVVDEVFYEVGELVRPSAPLVRLVDLREVTATFYLPNAELGAVRVGQRARVLADAFPDQPVEGTVITVSARAEFTPRNIQTRTDRDRLVYPIEVRVQNQDGPIQLRPGMPVQVTLIGEAR